MKSGYVFIRKVATFFGLPIYQKLVCAEAFLLLGIARACVLYLPFRYIAPYLGTIGKETDAVCTLENSAKVRQIAWAIEKIGYYTPWRSNCLAKAITGKIMLKQHRISSTLYLGVKKVDNSLEAHAWLRVGKNIITGNNDLDHFRVVASFGHS